MKLFYVLFLLSFSASLFANERALVVVIDLAEMAKKNKMLYKWETAKALHRIKKFTEGHYDHIIIHNRKEATKANFYQSLENLFQNPEVKTIDTIIYLHGQNDSYKTGASVCFVGDACSPMKDVAAEISAYPEAKTKLRMMYSDACWGTFHTKYWLEAGYKVANGSKGVDANKSADLKRFLKQWTNGASFEEAIEFANRAPITALTDFLLKDANSIKTVVGDGKIRLED